MTQSVVRLERVDAVGFVLIDNPPVNALGAAVRRGLVAALAEVEADPDLLGAVILAEGKTFPAGADIAEFGQPRQDPLLPEVVARFSAATKPVVAALHGTVLGGGLELALAATARVAAPGTKLGFPEVKLGLLPGAGGTQTAPRLIGAEAALDMMLSGAPVTAEAARDMGLIDDLVEGDLPQAAMSLVLLLADGAELPRQKADPGADLAAVARARAAAEYAPIAAPQRIVDCVEAALLLPPQMGLNYEAAAFAELLPSTEAAALRHIFFAERRAGKMPGAAARARSLRSVAVLGGGKDGLALTRALIGAGVHVTLADLGRAELEPAMITLDASLKAEVAAGTLADYDRGVLWERVVPALAGDLGGVDAVIVTGEFARPGTRIDGLPDGILILTLGRVGQGGSQALGVVPGARLAELLVSATSAPEAVATALSLLRRLGLICVRAQGLGIASGLRAALDQALTEIGATEAARVRALWGLGDGAKLRRGTDLVGGTAAKVQGALANAGLRLLGEGRALRPSDIDLVAVMSLGLPRHSGGPMFWADRRGALVLRHDLERWAETSPDLWTPAPLLDSLIREGVGLDEMNKA